MKKIDKPGKSLSLTVNSQKWKLNNEKPPCTKVKKTDNLPVGECREYKRVRKRKVVPTLVWKRTFLHDVILSFIPDKLLKQFSDKP